uniref:Uncharacterized protein n=1 Tax=Meloidogyne enterolobii TaxID=390850 RepID=A0A6V7U6F6_MELEN|nr:unnamed protein product [Meloidogyne enterolobii]
MPNTDKSSIRTSFNKFNFFLLFFNSSFMVCFRYGSIIHNNILNNFFFNFRCRTFSWRRTALKLFRFYMNTSWTLFNFCLFSHFEKNFLSVK